MDDKESDSDDEEEYYLKRDEMGRPFYGPNLMSYFDRNDPMEHALAIQDSSTLFEKIMHGRKQWVPKGPSDFVKEIGDGRWHTNIRVTDAYGNTFEQGYEARSTNSITYSELIESLIISYLILSYSIALSLQVGITTILAKLLDLDMPVDCTILIIAGRSFLHTCEGIINTLKGTTSTFDGVCH
ncbi:hypothetical protein Tco_0248055 [Tanacetum coccineum]